MDNFNVDWSVSNWVRMVVYNVLRAKLDFYTNGKGIQILAVLILLPNLTGDKLIFSDNNFILILLT